MHILVSLKVLPTNGMHFLSLDSGKLFPVKLIPNTIYLKHPMYYKYMYMCLIVFIYAWLGTIYTQRMMNIG
jgi:hypothetical protein